MRKGILLAVLFLALVVVVAAPVWAAQFQVGKPVYWVNEAAHNMDVAPFIENGRTYVPVRYLAYALGVPEDGVFWNTRDQAVYLCAGDTGIFLVVGKPVLLVVRGRDAALLARLFQLQDLIEKKGKWAAIPALAQALQEFRELEEVLEMEDSDIKAWLKKRAEAVAMDVVPVIRKDRVFLPARFVAEAFGYEVAWRPAEQKVLLSPQGLSEAKEAGVDEATRPAAPVASGPPPVDEDLVAEYKHVGAQLVGVQGKHWFLSVSGGPTGGYVPQRLIITDPETGERRSYSAEAPEWKRDPVVIARPGLADLIETTIRDLKFQATIRPMIRQMDEFQQQRRLKELEELQMRQREQMDRELEKQIMRQQQEWQRGPYHSPFSNPFEYSPAPRYTPPVPTYTPPGFSPVSPWSPGGTRW